jgi:hypothetical protein
MNNQWFYAVMVIAAGVTGGYVGNKLASPAAASASEAPTKVIAAQEILLVDAKGNTHGALRFNKDGEPGFALYDHNGKLRSNLEISDDDGWGIKFFDPSGAVRISMTVSAEDIPALRLFDAQAHPRTLLGVDPDGESALDFYTEQGRLLRELP